MQATEFVKSYIEAWNHHDPVEVADHLATNGIYRDVPEQAQRSHDELITNLYAFFKRSKHRYALLGDVLTNNETVAFQYRMIPERGNGEDQTIYQGAEFITLRDDSALLIIDYYEAAEAQRDSIMNGGRNLPTHKYAKSGLTGPRLKQYKSCLEKVMNEHQLFLQSGLTLPQLAETVGCSVNHLSQVINAGFGVSFFSFINAYRIEHAKKLLDNLDERGAVLNIAFSVGFNSNSAFYATFKKHVGMTPTQYRRSRQKRL
jgi:AraC-like DNA-binding protein